jgi:tetratricopeptide (TPR) repeat protein
MKNRYCFTNPVFILRGILPSLALFACATPPLTDEPVPQAAEESVVVEETIVPVSERPPIDADVMYRVLAAEYLGSEGDFKQAAGEYLEAALNSDDPMIAQRATRVAISTQSWQQAAMAADRWTVLDPHNLDARELAVVSMLHVGDYVGAEHQMEQILELLKHDQSHAWEMIATLLSRAENPQKATAVLERLLMHRGSEDNMHALYAQSQLAARTGNLINARELAEMAIVLSPERAELLVWAGRLAVSQGDNDSAIDHYGQAWNLDPVDRDVSLAYAELLNRSGSASRAQQVLEGLPDTPEVRFTRIAYALQAGDQELASSLFEHFPEGENGDSAEQGFYAGQSAELLGYTDVAIQWYSRVEHGERAVFASLRRAFLLARSERIDEARGVLADMREDRIPSVLIESYEAESAILRQAGQLPVALQVLTEALEWMPGNSRLQYAQALVAVELGQIEFAEETLRSVIEREPDNAAAINALGYTLADLTDRLDEAEDLIHAAYALQPNEASIIDSMGWIAYRQGRFVESERYLREALARSPNPEIAAHLGEVLWVSGKQDAARAAWAEALTLSSDNVILLETMARFGLSP